ncbi:MAG: adenylate/guanylate cyclase domain-containing protein [Oculatellaceae cyanobacterium bins.114]|nr:adenylate/guanylate cyclase domain-containing protein [Oculatellaceae cyanobacterium bins.114]
MSGNTSNKSQSSANTSDVLTSEMFIKSSNLDILYEQSKEVNSCFAQAKDNFVSRADNEIRLMLQRAILALKGLDNSAMDFNSDDWSLDPVELATRKSPNDAFYLYHITELQRFYLLEEYAHALEIAEVLKETVQSLSNILELAEYYFYYSLSLAALYLEATEEIRKEYQVNLSRNLNYFKQLSDDQVEGCYHKYLLISAEMNRFSGNALESMELYDQAIASAQDDGFVKDQALANELAAKFYLSLGRTKVAKTYMADAYSTYSQWGATAKVDQLEQKYADLIAQFTTESKNSQHLEKLLQNQIELTQAYSRFVPKEFLQFLGKTSIVDVELGDQIQLEMSVLFADICDFTTLSEQMTPKENFKFINSYFSHMESAITENNGFIDKYIGDSIMALFNGEVNDAVNAAIAMVQRLTEYNQDRVSFGQPQIKIGIGINTGSLMLGTVGGANRMDSTVISDAVNLSARIEKLTREYEVTLLISQQTLTRLHNPEQYSIRMIDQVKVKGKLEPVTVYEVFDADPPELRDGKLLTAKLLTEALSLFNERRYRDATRLLETCLDQNPHDKVARIYLERCLKSGLHLMQEL